MVYLGGKTRIGTQISAVLRKLRNGRKYVEPFVGAAGVIIHMDGEREASDIDEDIIILWENASRGWIPPTDLTESEYNSLRRSNEKTPLRSFAKYACSFGGKAWGGYARGNRNYAALGSASVVRKSAKLGSVTFRCSSFEECHPVDCLVYCDPPYARTTQYETKFDHELFWDVVRLWSKSNTVVVSEYEAPADFCVVAEFPILNKLNRSSATERLFMAR